MPRPNARLTAHRPLAGLDGLERDWSFRPSRPSPMTRMRRLRSLATGLRPAPPHLAIVAAGPERRWNAYFAYLPTGRLTPAHEYTLRRLRALPGGLLVVCAAPGPQDVPQALTDLADAVYWKGLAGFDFSAYALAVRVVASRSAGADLFVMNDSVLGPLSDPEPMLAASRWDLTGFTASSAVENHIQSYAFYLRGVTPERLAGLRTILPARFACHAFQDVVALQETRFARIASRSMSVGSLWYADEARIGDPSLFAAAALLEAGFPFLKRSLLGRFGALHAPGLLEHLLEERGHPSAF